MIYLIPIIAFWFAKITFIPQSITVLRRKPFNCSKCMGFWLGLFYQFAEWKGIDSIIIACLTSFGAYLLEVVFEKLKIKVND